MKRFLVIIFFSISFFGGLFSQQASFITVVPDGDRAIFEQAREAYKDFLDEVQRVGAQYKDQLSQPVAFDRLGPIIEKAEKQLFESKNLLEQKLTALPIGSDDVRQAYVLITTQLDGYYRTLRAFSHLKRDAESKFGGTQGLFTAASYAYGFCDNIFQLYKKDNPTHWWREGILDMGLRSALASWFFFLNKSELGNGLLSQAILGNLEISPLSSMVSLGSLPAAAGIFVNPSPLTQGAHNVLRGSGKLAAALIYYHLFNGRGKGNHEASRDERMRKAILGSVHETQDALFDELSHHIRKNFYPQVVEKVEQFTLSLIKPELIGKVFQTIFPLFLLENEPLFDKIVPCDSVDAQKRQELLFSLFSDGKFENLTKYSKEGNVRAHYIEYRIISYISECLGCYCGWALAGKYKQKIGPMTSKGVDKTINMCAKLHLISKDEAELLKGYKEEFCQEVKIASDELKRRFRALFVVGSMERMMFAWYLGWTGDMTSNDSIDSIAVTRQMLQFILENLSDYRLVSYLQAAAIEQNFEKNPAQINESVDKIIEIVEKNIVTTVGSAIGGHIAQWIARCIMRIHGPFYSKRV